MGCTPSRDIHSIEEYGYTGEIKFVDDEVLMQGSGRQENEDGSVYTGKFKNNLYHGYGIMQYFTTNESHAEDPVSYQGTWKNGSKVGKGKITYYDGSYYYGTFNYDKIHGKGIYVFADGHKYIGDFFNETIQGKGKLYDKYDNIVYLGEFFNDKYHGKGTLYVDNVRHYTGNFVNGLFHGEGKLYDCEGYFIQRGYFENGVLVENNIAIADIVEYDENNPEIPYAEAYISTDVENNNISNNSIYQEYRTSSYIF